MELAPPAPLDQIEWRPHGKPVGTDQNRCLYVAYVKAHTVSRLLDDWVGPEGWKNTYQPDVLFGAPVMWCTVFVWIRDEWIGKDDLGVPSAYDPQKGAASDAFKRAAAKWGVGRNVYALPMVWGPCTKDNKGNPRPVPGAMGVIRAELAKQGIKDEAIGRLQETPGVESPVLSRPNRPGPDQPSESMVIDAETAEGLVAEIAKIDGERRTRVKKEFVARFGGPPLELRVSDLPAARLFVSGEQAAAAQELVAKRGEVTAAIGGLDDDAKARLRDWCSEQDIEPIPAKFTVAQADEVLGWIEQGGMVPT